MSLVTEAQFWKNKQKAVDDINDYDHLYSLLEERFSEHRKEIKKGEHHVEKDAREAIQNWNEND